MTPNHNHQNKIALINDMSGFGRCSAAVAIPVISMLRVQCCLLPTSIFSNHTGFPSFYYTDYTDHMQPSIDEWKKLGLQFAGIYTGFLGSARQIEIVKRFIRDFKTPETLVIIDPVMGDYGKPYPTYTHDLCIRMKELAECADILTPNLTEACILTDTPYKDGKWRLAEIEKLAQNLAERGPKKIVITGITQGDFIANFCYEAGKPYKMLRTHRVGTSRSGTGDIFASIIAADAINGVPFECSVRKASRFVKKCIECSIERDIPLTDGVCFEDVLHLLK